MRDQDTIRRNKVTKLDIKWLILEEVMIAKYCDIVRPKVTLRDKVTMYDTKTCKYDSHVANTEKYSHRLKVILRTSNKSTTRNKLAILIHTVTITFFNLQ